MLVLVLLSAIDSAQLGVRFEESETSTSSTSTNSNTNTNAHTNTNTNAHTNTNTNRRPLTSHRRSPRLTDSPLWEDNSGVGFLAGSEVADMLK